MVQSTTRLVAVAAAAALATLPTSPALASRGNSNSKQTICHATHSDTNPYVVITPNKNGDVSGHAKHTGPIWQPGLKAQHVAWGDIIPPFDYNDHGTPAHYPGQNWTASGRAVFADGCGIPITAAVVKTNDADGDGTFTDDETAGAAGSAVEFHVLITNTSAFPAVIASVSDVSGGAAVPFTCDPPVVGTTLPAGGSVTCDATVADYSPTDGGVRTNTVTVVLHQVGNPSNTGSASDTSVVRTTTGGGLGGGGTTGATTGTTTGGTTGATTGATTGTTGGAAGGGAGSFTGGGGALTSPTTSTAAPASGSGLPFTGLPTTALLATGALASLGGALLLAAASRRGRT